MKKTYIDERGFEINKVQNLSNNYDLLTPKRRSPINRQAHTSTNVLEPNQFNNYNLLSAPGSRK